MSKEIDVSISGPYGIGGLQTARRLWTEAMLGSGKEVDWYVSSKTEKELIDGRGEVPVGVKIQNIEAQQRLDCFPTAQAVWKFGADLVKEDPERIIIEGFNSPFMTGLVAAAIAVGRAENLVQIYHNKPENGYGNSGIKGEVWKAAWKTKILLAKLATNMGAKNLVVSEWVGERVKELGIDRNPIICYPPTGQRELINVDKERKAGQRLKVLTVGRVAGDKGLDLLFEVARESRQRGLPLDFRLVGPMADEATRKWAEEKSGCSVEIAGPKIGRELSNEYENADVLFFPSPKEGFGLVTIEALGQGLPVLARSAVTNEILDKTKGIKPGFVLPDLSEEESAGKSIEALLELQRNLEMWKAMSISAVQLAKQFSSQLLVEKFMTSVFGRIRNNYDL